MTANESPLPEETESSYFRRDCHVSNFRKPFASEWAPPEQESAREVLYRELLECAGDGIYGLDLNGHVTFANPMARRLTGWTIEDLRGRTQHSMLHHTRADGNAYPAEECPIYAALRDGMVHRRDDEVFWRKDGTSFAVSYVSAPIFRNGRPDGAVIVFRDLSSELLK